uniref:F-box-like family protein n=1 Tax=Pithovirus LCPAC401 TaxID=2506595 RepID=A0A481Z940_9VIRU|nr:MAG: uncharacterized protein LCPAC401_00520 [Pithovirus LCPAC401]
MSDVTAILRKLRLTRNNLNDLSSDEITYIFTNLTVKKISILCGINTKFNNICRRESLWRLKILNDYGISEPLSGKTWRDSARLFSIFNMIDMGKEWVNGMTYKELLDEADSRGFESLLYLNHIKNEHIEKVIGKEGNISWFYATSLDIDRSLIERHHIETTQEERNKITNILTREFGVISAAIAIRYYSYPTLPYARPIYRDEYPGEADYTGNERKSTNEIDIAMDELFDYMPYIVKFSVKHSQYLLNSAIYPDTH